MRPGDTDGRTARGLIPVKPQHLTLLLPMPYEFLRALIYGPRCPGAAKDRFLVQDREAEAAIAE